MIFIQRHVIFLELQSINHIQWKQITYFNRYVIHRNYFMCDIPAYDITFKLLYIMTNHNFISAPIQTGHIIQHKFSHIFQLLCWKFIRKLREKLGTHLDTHTHHLILPLKPFYMEFDTQEVPPYFRLGFLVKCVPNSEVGANWVYQKIRREFSAEKYHKIWSTSNFACNYFFPRRKRSISMYF